VQNLGRGISNLATGVSQAALAFSTQSNADQERRENFEAERAFQEIASNQSRSLEERKRGLPVGNPNGFTNTIEQEYIENVTPFFNTLPDRLKNQYDLRLFGLRRSLVNNARTFEQNETDRFETSEVTKAKNTTFSEAARTASTEELDAETARFKRFVDNTNLSPRVKDALKVTGLRDLGIVRMNSMTPAQIERHFAQPNSSIIDRIIGVESGGRADIKNPRSSATGLGQFIKSTWLDLIKRNRQDIAAGRTDAEILALRTDPVLSREMIGVLMSENADALQARGIQPTSGNLYLAHFLGAGGAIQVLQANPNTPVSRLLSSDAIRDNRSILAGRSAADVIKWAEGKMAGAIPEAFTHLSDDDKQKALKGIEGWLKTRARADQIISGQDVADPDNKDDRVAVDFVIDKSGLNERLSNMDPTSVPHLTITVETTGIIPDSSMSTLRSMAANGSPEEREFALQTTANLLKQKPGILEGKSGGKELRDDARKFSSYVLAGGLTPEDALKRVDETKTEEFRNKEAALGAEATTLAGTLKPEELTNAFDGFFTAEPELGATRTRGAIMFAAFKENFKFHFTKTGDEEVAKNLAMDDVRQTYNVSAVTGTNRLMKHPPEKYYQKIDGSHDYFMKQLKEDVTKRVGRDVEIDEIFIEAVPQTDSDIRVGRLPRYGVSWLTEDGKLDTAPGMVWKPDFASAKKRAIERRRKRTKELRKEMEDVVLPGFLGGELFLPETEGAPAEIIRTQEEGRQTSLLETLGTGPLS
jgi:hypothetical protein